MSMFRKKCACHRFGKKLVRKCLSAGVCRCLGGGVQVIDLRKLVFEHKFAVV